MNKKNGAIGVITIIWPSGKNRRIIELWQK